MSTEVSIQDEQSFHAAIADVRADSSSTDWGVQDGERRRVEEVLDGRGGWGMRWRGGERSEVQGREGVLQLHITNQPGRESVTSFSPKRHFKNAPCTELCIAKKKTGIRIDGV